MCGAGRSGSGRGRRILRSPGARPAIRGARRCQRAASDTRPGARRADRELEHSPPGRANRPAAPVDSAPNAAFCRSSDGLRAPLVRPRGRLLGSPSRPSQRPRSAIFPGGRSPPAAGRPSSVTRGASRLILFVSPHLWMGLWKTSSRLDDVVSADCRSDLWDSGSTALRAQLAEATWNTWFREVRPVRCDGDVLVLAVPNAVACERIRLELHRPPDRPAPRRHRPGPRGRADRRHRAPPATTRWS